ncbi:MAG: sugar phosphate isomerase/epimerase [Bacteroidales bacterium]
MATRRNFLKTMAAISAGSMVLPLSSFKFGSNTPFGLILYTVRDEMKKDASGTLAKIAEIGYQVVEAAGYDKRKFYGLAPLEFKKLVESYGLKLVSSHHSLSDKNYKEIVEDAALAGLEFAVYPWMMSGNADYFKKKAEELNKYGEEFKKAGIRFCYHNHDFEFKTVDNQLPYDILLKNTNPEYVSFEMDLYWTTKAGFKPIEYFTANSGRFPLWHVKDMKNDEKKSFAEVGNGTIDFASIFSKKDTSGMKYYFVEQDTCVDHPPLESIKISLDYIKKQGF